MPSRRETERRAVSFQDSSSSEDEYEYWNKEQGNKKYKKSYKKYDYSKDKDEVDRYYDDEDYPYDLEGDKKKSSYKNAQRRNEYGSVGNSISSMFSAQYWHFTIFILFEAINMGVVWWTYWAVNGEHNLADLMEKSRKAGKLVAFMAVAKTALKHTINSDDVYAYMALAIFVTIAALYNMTLIAIMRNSKHLPIVIGVKMTCCLFFLGIVIYENANNDALKMLLRILGLDWGYTYGAPACIGLLCFNFIQIAFIWFMFFVGREREIEAKHQERRALLASQFDDEQSYSRKASGSKKNKSTKRDSDDDDSDYDSEPEAEDIESGKKSKNNKGNKKGGKKMNNNKKTVEKTNVNNYETTYNIQPPQGLYGFNNPVAAADPVVHRIVLQPQQQVVQQSEPNVTYLTI